MNPEERYSTRYHAPVLYREVVEALLTDLSGVYVDGTLGGGGHTAALLEQLTPEGRVIGIDQDPAALEAAVERFAAQPPGRFVALHGNFADMERLLRSAGIEVVDGILVDLGVSSHQIDTPGRGFSYSMEGPLDMRMNTTGGMMASEIINRWSEADLRRLFREYGEEPRAPKIAREIAQRRPLETTEELAEVIRRVVPHREAVKTLSRIFQAVRIAVNDEITVLERALFSALKVLRVGGRLAVISYHSLEDRPVKQFFKYGNLKGEPVHDFYGNLLTPWRKLTRKPVTPTDEEINFNPRARSARLRVAEKTAQTTT